MRNLFFLFAIILGIFIIAGNGWTFRCGLGLVSTGDSESQVLVTCGEPASKKQKCESRHPETGICIKEIDIWTYNCGEGDFFYELTFNEKDILIQEKATSRGKGNSHCKGNTP
ncbi:hypothetical protein ASZ90_008312 [hydrocarbon metagenome]|uniref:DUF2845 domain-containing protein n=1 Tax=hydrocarbon metagenome TaxID=938273 RepID=A0A0W8FM20_9ZZZZ